MYHLFFMREEKDSGPNEDFSVQESYKKANGRLSITPFPPPLFAKKIEQHGSREVRNFLTA